ncbi:sugar phosphate isomerase/epimerase family protein [Rubinisphaera italica]|uniref:D-tagatose 3-epimerase n=1 Tax=Rubinisphaera italica TaxID=2527969 RepID=A0A5C5XCR9_9PLAN|nr:sugar phosphate isomerase/epimerase [Rubinisphaera italica]TWT60103.1 D-tagatose 3-epimerase [Rubinisphaera italica]HBN74589.1 isomerase [Planctomycetaceae bacterium]
MKYGMNLLLWTAGVTEDHFSLLDDIKSWGYDGVELPMFDFDLGMNQKIGEKLKSTGLGATAVTVCTPEENPISPDAAIRQAGLERLKRAIDACQAAGAEKLCGPIHSALGEFTGSGRTEDEWKWAQEILTQAADHAKQADVTLVCEYLNRFECYFLNCAEDCSRFTREVNHPNLKMMYDTFHANIEEKSITGAVEACQDQMVHVHISENDRSTPGEGGVNWDESFAALKKVNYDGWFVIEAFGLALPELAAATRIWRRMYPSEEHLAKEGLAFMKSRWENS